MSNLPEHIDETFNAETILLDGTTYRDCTFVDCVFVFRGEAPFSLTDNMIDATCTWRFEGAAALTAAAMRSIYHGFGAEGRALIEATLGMEPPPHA